MLFRIFNKRIRNPGAMFSGHYIDVKAFYTWHFNKLPCVSFIGEIDVSKAYAYISERYQYSIETVYQHAWYEHKEDKMLFNNTIFIFHDTKMIELANDYCHVLFEPAQYGWANGLVKELAAFRKAPNAEAGRVMGFARQVVEN